ncbi:hypothetical protein ACWGXJ_04780 [Paenibacillus sp. S33]
MTSRSKVKVNLQPEYETGQYDATVSNTADQATREKAHTFHVQVFIFEFIFF